MKVRIYQKNSCFTPNNATVWTRSSQVAKIRDCSSCRCTCYLVRNRVVLVRLYWIEYTFLQMCLFDHVERHWLVPVPEEHAAADVVQGTDHPQTADTAAWCARPCLPTFQLHLHRQQLHTRTGICALQTEPQVITTCWPTWANTQFQTTDWSINIYSCPDFWFKWR